MLRALEFYSGIGECPSLPQTPLRADRRSSLGGLHLALAQSNVDGSVVRAFDWDQAACRVYAANHGPDVVRKVAR